jgi:short-subunit dehydrogenase
VADTDFRRVAGQRTTPYQRMVMMDSRTVARIGVEAMLRGRSSVVPGRLNAVMAWSNRLVPRRLSTALAQRLMVVR